MEQYLYETHLHTAPISRCARASLCESLHFYKSLGYAGVFVTNHFIDGNIGCDKSLSYGEMIEFYFSEESEAEALGAELGIDVFFGIEMSYGGTDFLVYGLDKAWFLAHPEIAAMKKSEQLPQMAAEGALVIQAHPFREAHYIDHIRLFPRAVHGVEVYNASRGAFENEMAERYAEAYGLLPFAGSDNHVADRQRTLGGMASPTPIRDVRDFIDRVKSREIVPFRKTLE